MQKIMFTTTTLIRKHKNFCSGGEDDSKNKDDRRPRQILGVGGVS